MEANQITDAEFKTMVIKKLNENYQKLQENYEELTANHISMKRK